MEFGTLNKQESALGSLDNQSLASKLRYVSGDGRYSMAAITQQLNMVSDGETPAVSYVSLSTHTKPNTTVAELVSVASGFLAARLLLSVSFFRGAVINLADSHLPKQESLFWLLTFIWVALFSSRTRLESRLRWLQRGSFFLLIEALFLLVLEAFAIGGLERSSFLFFLLASIASILIQCAIQSFTSLVMPGLDMLKPGSRILIIGSRSKARDVITGIRNANTKYEVIGCLDPDPGALGTEVAGVRVLGSTTTLKEYIFGCPVDLILFAMPLELVADVKHLIDAALQAGLPVSVITDSGLERLGYGVCHGIPNVEDFCGLPVVTLSNLPQGRTYLICKRISDILVSTILLVLLSPLFLVLGILVKLTSPRGPIFYRWKVLGRNRRPFVGYKFRTMVPEADELKQQLLDKNEMKGPVFKMREDPRVIPVGKFLRKYSLDELPQLYSVLKGDMSLVGPRPPSREEADQFEFWQRRKLGVTPGITCLWQVNGRNNINSFDEWARLDLEYIQRASLFLDFQILFRTIPAVILGRGAH
jgi:exopolysaccharide biosynthesis polyprenyl glycosylphosphotransferase